MVEQGTLRRIATPVSGDRFDIRVDPHAHLLCTCCGRVLDLEDTLISELDRNVMRTTGFLVNDRQLLLSGICADCLAAQPVHLAEGGWPDSALFEIFTENRRDFPNQLLTIHAGYGKIFLALSGYSAVW